MEAVNQILTFIGKLLDWWFLVMPWEQAIFVRGGSKVKLLGRGLYFKIPFYDKVFIQTSRVRAIDSPIQTISTLDGKTVTIKSIVWYAIGDMYKLYNTMSHPEMTLTGMITGYMSEYIRTTSSQEITPEKAEKFANEKINADQYGLKDVSIKITSWAEVKTFRLIQDASWISESMEMGPIK